MNLTPQKKKKKNNMLRFLLKKMVEHPHANNMTCTTCACP